jgi:2-iminoacetate synthase
MIATEESTFIDEQEIEQVLARGQNHDARHVYEVLAKARELRGLNMDDMAALMAVDDPELLDEVFATARWVKEEIYGNRLVLFAPLYISNRCSNDCAYCGFRTSNPDIKRRSLNQEEIRREVEEIEKQGHKRILMLAGEAYGQDGLKYVLDSIKTIYDTKVGRGEIRRVNVNLAAMPVEAFRALKAAQIGTYQLFQETYHRETYMQMHRGGPKRNYDFHVTAMDRAQQAGIDDVGVGILFGLYDWRFEMLAMMQHIHHLEREFGVGPHTISVPRIEPAIGSPVAEHPPYQVSDRDFLKIVAIFRLAVPYTGIIMSTREQTELRRQTFLLGVSQISAGSRVDPGGYAAHAANFTRAQFQVGDSRTTDDVIRDIVEMGFIPSFCTACYRLGRTGSDFMDMAKPGEIKYHCTPNALSTFAEYLNDYASPATREVGRKMIQKMLNEMEEGQCKIALPMIRAVDLGKRDVFV